MIEFTLGIDGSARVWIDEHPQLGFAADHVLANTHLARPHITASRRGAVELFIPSGALADYALLCGDFVPDELGQLSLQVPVVDSFGEPLAWALAARVDDVRAGLPAEYAQAVRDAGATASAALGSGTLKLGPAAHARVGSSPSIFAATTAALIDIMAMAASERSQASLAQAIQTRATQQRPQQ